MALAASCSRVYLVNSGLDLPMSDPTPIRLPPKASSADSPPDDPPGVRLRLRGFTVRPKMLLTVSGNITAVGTLVFTYSTAPASTIISMSVLLYVEGLFAREAMPIVESLPIILKLSLMEIGSPWKGPLVLPYFWRYASHSFARAIASSKKISARQLVCVLQSVRLNTPRKYIGELAN